MSSPFGKINSAGRESTPRTRRGLQSIGSTDLGRGLRVDGSGRVELFVKLPLSIDSDALEISLERLLSDLTVEAPLSLDGTTLSIGQMENITKQPSSGVTVAINATKINEIIIALEDLRLIKREKS